MVYKVSLTNCEITEILIKLMRKSYVVLTEKNVKLTLSTLFKPATV